MGKYEKKVNYRKDALKAADELGYGEAVKNKIRKAKSDYEISRILANARESEQYDWPRLQKLEGKY